MIIRKGKAFLSLFQKMPFLIPYWGGNEFIAMILAILKLQISQGTGIAVCEQKLKELLTSYPQNDEGSADIFICSKRGSLPYDLLGEAQNVQFVIATNMGRSAIELGLRGLGISTNDEVIVPAFACRGVASPVVRVGAVPVFADVDLNFNLNLASLIPQVTNRTRAIIVPHIGGKAAVITEIVKFAKEKGILILDDACQATGGTYEGKLLGTFGDIGIFSFGMGKNIMATAGGALITNNENVYKFVTGSIEGKYEGARVITARMFNRLLYFRFIKYTTPFHYLITHKLLKRFSTPKEIRNIGTDDYEVTRMSNLDAQILLQQLKKLQTVIVKRRRNALILLKELWECGGDLTLPDPQDHIFTKFIVTLNNASPPKELGFSRDILTFVRYCYLKGIATENVYTPLHLRHGFTQYARTPLPNVENLWWRSIALPVRPNLSEKDMMYITKAIKTFFKNS